MIQCQKNSIYHDTQNSSSESLGAGAEFVGPWTQLDNFVKILVTVNTDVISGTLGLVIQFTGDPESELVTSESTTVSLNVSTGVYGGTYVYNVSNKYYRIKYKNGPAAQNFLLLQTVLKKIVDGEQITTPLSVIKTQQTSNAVRIVSDLKKDIAMGLIEYNKNFNVNGTRYSGIDETETILASITSKEYQWPKTAQRLRIKAGGSADDIVYGSGAKAIQINGLDSNYEEISEIVYTAGTSASAWTTSTFLRVNSVVTVASGSKNSNEGMIIIENETDQYELSSICPRFGRALSSVFTTSRHCSCVISRILFMSGSSHSVTLRGYFREYSTGTNYIINVMPGLCGTTESTQQNYIKFNPRTDFWATGQKVAGVGLAEASIVYELDILITN